MTCEARVRVPGKGWKDCERRFCLFGPHRAKATRYITVMWPRKPLNHPMESMGQPRKCCPTRDLDAHEADCPTFSNGEKGGDDQ